MILERISAWFKKLTTLRGRAAVKAYSVVGAGLLGLGALLSLAYNYIYLPHFTLQPGFSASSSAQVRAPQEARDVPGPINGMLFTATEAKAWQNRKPLAVIIENHFDSRPQSGLAGADVVYEALAEGGITRYLAMYLTNPANVSLGPIRSVRTYFLDWLEEYDGLAAHVGGNMDALDRIAPERVKDLDQFGLGNPTYGRTTDRLAPHNVYTSTDLLWKAADKKGFTGSSSFHNWPFKTEATPSARPSNQTLRLGFLGDVSYKVAWTYSQATNTYLRSVGGADAVDANANTRISAKTIIVEVVPMQTGVTRIGEQTIIMSDTGAGKAKIFQDGVETDATWTKKTRTERTTFWDAQEKEIPINRGSIWIEVVPPGSPIDF